MDKDIVQPGIHSSAEPIIECDFSKAEKEIVKFWARDWLITSAGKRTTPGRSDFKFFLAKPAPHIEEALNLSREIIVILSPYKNFEPRTLEAFDTIRKEYLDQRYESICYALISADTDVEQKLKAWLTNQENQIVVPFSYSDFEALLSLRLLSATDPVLAESSLLLLLQADRARAQTSAVIKSLIFIKTPLRMIFSYSGQLSF